MPNARTFTGSAEINAVVARVAPAILLMLADGMPRTKAAIVRASPAASGQGRRRPRANK